jgi:hypothetical protein
MEKDVKVKEEETSFFERKITTKKQLRAAMEKMFLPELMGKAKQQPNIALCVRFCIWPKSRRVSVSFSLLEPMNTAVVVFLLAAKCF